MNHLVITSDYQIVTDRKIKYYKTLELKGEKNETTLRKNNL